MRSKSAVGVLVGAAALATWCMPSSSVAQCIGQSCGFCSGDASTACSLDVDCGVNAPCIGGNGAGTYPHPDGAHNWTVTGGQVNGAGASLFVDFFRQPSSTNDWVDVNGDGLEGFDLFNNPPFGVDQLSTLFQTAISSDGDTYWNFNFRSIGSVNGLNEFIESQTCSVIPIQVVSEAGIANTFEYAAGDVIEWGGLSNWANQSGTPFEQSEIEFAVLDVPGSWGVQNSSAAGAWNRYPTEPGYGVGSGIPSTNGFISELPTLSNSCGMCANVKRIHPPRSCSGDASIRCASDADCGVNGPCEAGTLHPSNLCSDTMIWTSNAIGGTYTTPCPATAEGIPCTAADQCPLYTCSGSGAICGHGYPPCPGGETCDPADTCDTSLAGSATLNTDVLNADENTIFSYGVPWVPVAALANRGVGRENIRYTEWQWLLTTGRMPNGENLVGATRDVGSGTRNDAMNSLGIDTSWARGDNVGSEAISSSTDLLGPNWQQANRGGSSRMEGTVQNGRLSVGYTGLAGGSRSAGDTIGGKYEILGVCKDVASPGECDNDPGNFCVADSECPAGGTCVGVLPACDCDATGYVRPSINTVLDNCDPCTGYQISSTESFVLRGNIDSNRRGTCTSSPVRCDVDADCGVDGPCVPDPNYIPGNPGEKVDNQAVADYLINIIESVDSFSGSVIPGECTQTSQCSGNSAACTSDTDCNIGTCSVTVATMCHQDSECPVGESCVGGEFCRALPCSADSDCPLNGNRECDTTPVACTFDFDCPGSELCIPEEFCKLKQNSPGQYLATTFFLPPALDCIQEETAPLKYNAVATNQALQDFTRTHNDLDVGASPDGHEYDYGVNNEAGLVPARTSGPVYSDGTLATAYWQWNGGAYVTANSGVELSTRNRVQADMNGDFLRDAEAQNASCANSEDGAELVKAWDTPRTWQSTSCSAGPLAEKSLPADFKRPEDPNAKDFLLGFGAIPEVIGDFDGDGSLTKEDMRYWADGLAIVRRCPDDNTFCGGSPANNCPHLDRKVGAMKIDAQLALQQGVCRNSNLCFEGDGTLAVDAACDSGAPGDPCGTGGTCVAQRCSSASDCNLSPSDFCDPVFPWADDRHDLFVAKQVSPPVNHQLLRPAPINDMFPADLVANTGKTYADGDFRADVSGRALWQCDMGGGSCYEDADCPGFPTETCQTGAKAFIGAQPFGWDGRIDNRDIDYVCENFRASGGKKWGEQPLDVDIHWDLSADMNGDLRADTADVAEIVVSILGTNGGDANLDGLVDATDQAIVTAGMSDSCNSDASCGWADGDFNCSGTVDSEDQDILDATNAYSAPAAADPEAPAYDKARHISFVPGNPGVPTALRITLVDLPSPHDILNGTQLWVDTPQIVCENSGQDGSVPPANCVLTAGYPSATFATATLSCTPVFYDFGSIGETLHVYDETIIPKGRYTVEAITQSAYDAGLGVYSAPLDLYTSCLFADTVSDCSTSVCGAPDNVVSVPTDCVALVDKFKNIGPPTPPNLAIISARADLLPALVDQKITIGEVTACLSAFQGQTDYTLPVPTPCP